MAVIPFIERSQRIPLGLSAYAQGKRLKLPLFAWKRRGYLISEDRFAAGWWRFEICIRTENSGFAVHWDWNLFKEHHG
jgi:hypothetical protein